MNTSAMRSNFKCEIDSFRPEDATGIVRLFEAVYGDGYPIKMYYDRDKLSEANRTGECLSVVARTPEGRVIGNHNLVRSAPYAYTYEWAAGLVLDEYRAYGVTGKIVDYMLNDLAPRTEIQEIFGEPTLTQILIQKMSVGLKFVETALELGLLPASLYSKEKPSTERVSTLIQFRAYKPKPQAVFVPRPYEEELRFLYSALDDERTLVAAQDNVQADGAADIGLAVFDFARVARVAVNHPGSDFGASFEDVEKKALDQNVIVIQVWLGLDSPAVSAAVDVLRSKGYFIGGILPRWFDADGLLMQKIWFQPDFESLVIHTDRAREIARLAARDWTRASSQ
ncbi:MAG: hypothetical protein V1816_18380 [Pseudomonadota bacterium]